jgi:hypothetical protein
MQVNGRMPKLRSAVNRGDGGAVMALAPRSPSPDEPLQLLGDGIATALVQHVEGAAEYARALAATLRERAWYGDEHLAEQLDALVGERGALARIALPVDLAELADALEGDPLGGGGRVDLQTGEVWHRSAIEYALEMGEEDEESAEDPARWLPFDCQGSHEGYRDMELFIETVADPDRADRLSIAIDGRGAFRRFKDVLERWPEEKERWYSYSEERQRARARAWLAEAGYCPAPGE